MQSDDLFYANYCSHDHINMQLFFFNESIELFIWCIVWAVSVTPTFENLFKQSSNELKMKTFNWSRHCLELDISLELSKWFVLNCECFCSTMCVCVCELSVGANEHVFGMPVYGSRYLIMPLNVKAFVYSFISDSTMTMQNWYTKAAGQLWCKLPPI